jgi:hypothetical protein
VVAADSKRIVLDQDEISDIRERQPTLTDEAAIEDARLHCIAPMDRIPALTRPIQEMAMALDPTTAFVLGFIDGLLPLETILDVAGLPEAETLAIIERMIQENVIVFVPAPGPPSRR